MIVAAGLTPAWQQIASFERFEPGEVNRATAVEWCSSGKVINVAIALRHLGAAVKTVALIGGAHGRLIEAEFASLGIAAHWVQARHATRVCTTILDRATGRTTELVENAGPVEIGELEQFVEAYCSSVVSAEMAVLAGSLPQGAGEDFYSVLLEHTRCPAILDVRGPELVRSLRHRPLVIKPNREELAKTCGRSLSSDDSLLAAMRELNQLGAQWVVITQGKDAVWASGDGQAYRLQPPSMRLVNPIASGDSMAAGIAWALTSGRNMLDALRLGIAAASENVTQLLPARIDADRVLATAERVQVDPIVGA
jgi:1-phosphofructokinase family hexose kinase